MKIKYSQVTVYFWTGTGNSYRMGCWLVDQARKMGITADLKHLNQGNPALDIGEGGEQLLVLTYPIHALTMPWAVLRFVLKLPARKGTHVLIMPSRGGTKLGETFLPGLEGTGGYLVALIMAVKGYFVRGVQAIDMPPNWLLVHSGYSKENSKAIIDRARLKVNALTERIITGGQRFGGIMSLLLGIIFLPLTIAYLLMGRFFLAKLFFASERCTGCGLCARSCPQGAIKMVGQEGKNPYWTFSCQSCMRCINFCPVQAVEASHPLAVLFYLLSTFPAAYYLATFFPQVVKLQTSWVGLVIHYFLAFILIFLIYQIFHWLSRVPLFNRIFTYTTLTRVFRRYHEPGTEIKDISQ